MKQTIDARGLACPQPVVLTDKAIAVADQVTVIVDNATAMENVTRLAQTKGFAVETSEKADGIYLTLRKESGPAGATGNICPPTAAATGATVLFVPSDCMGRGSAELGEKLMGAFFHALSEVEPKPRTIIFLNAGVKLAVEGSPALDDLRALAARGSEILACGTCLGYFDLKEKLAVGRVSNMYEIATALLEAGKVVEL